MVNVTLGMAGKGAAASAAVTQEVWVQHKSK